MAEAEAEEESKDSPNQLDLSNIKEEVEEILDGQSPFNSARRENKNDELFKPQGVSMRKSKALMMRNKPSSTKGSTKKGITSNYASSNQKSQNMVDDFSSQQDMGSVKSQTKNDSNVNDFQSFEENKQVVDDFQSFSSEEGAAKIEKKTEPVQLIKESPEEQLSPSPSTSPSKKLKKLAPMEPEEPYSDGES